ncbi:MULTISPECIES: hypothetical protein [Paraburkholderia]|uniref:DUF4148 domain-containing protein n=1 Tax=Paraburkholderia madseniana TaxID=2599607 RepID=A0AAP5ERA3_9BURK|nr:MULTISPECIES: hypothetical protein [Paraburkholderia]MCX4150061.1 hypothetical protein [Paraburkholderia madseniana]MDN7152996.1 hypothetical protein [Paraburkholderia sp. WS6]MDQ6411878.1 hypothetical protein [Paraburkholderia madseniana]
MRSRQDSSYKCPLCSLAMVMTATVAFQVAVVSLDAAAQGKSPGQGAAIKAPPLPNGSAQIDVRPGMSDTEWKNAYKETGRPRFDPKKVKHVGDTVERD